MTPELMKQWIDYTVPQMEGWCTVEKAIAMAELILEHKHAALVVELGVFGGRSLVPQALACREIGGHIYGIDPWRKEACLEGTNDPANDEWWAKLDLEAIHRSCMDHIWKNELERWCTVIRNKGEHVVDLFPDFPGGESIDVLHIDGNHSELASTRDVKLWMPRVHSGGYIWMDDSNWASTQQAVALIKEQCDHVKDVGTLTGQHPTLASLFRKR